MNFIEEFERIYKLKKLDEIDEINDFCGKWDGIATVDQIPYFMRLYYDYVSTSEQNSFVSNVIYSIIEKNPKESIKKIIENINILYEEEASHCMLQIVCLLVYSNDDFIPYTVKELMNANAKINKIFIDFVKSDMDPTNIDRAYRISEKFIILYNEEKGNLNYTKIEI